MTTITQEQTYHIFDEKDSSKALATNLTADEVEAWWRQNERKYFGVKIERENIIIVERLK